MAELYKDVGESKPGKTPPADPQAVLQGLLGMAGAELPPLPSEEKSPLKEPQAILPEPPQAPADQAPEPGMGTKVARAATILMAGLGGNPEMAALLLRRFDEQDKLVADRVQEDFANKMAVVQAQRTGILAQVEQAQEGVNIKRREKEFQLNRAQEARVRQAQPIQMQLDVLNLMSREKEFAVRQAELDNSPQDLQRARLELDYVQEQLKILNERVEAVPKEPANLQTDFMAQAQILGLPKFMEIQNAGGNTYEAAQRAVAEQRGARVERVKGEFRQSPAFQEMRANLSPISQSLLDQAVGSMPDPVTGSAGNPQAFGEAVVGMSDTDRDTMIVGLSRQWVAEGRFPNEQAAQEELANMIHRGIPPQQWNANLPQAGTLKESKFDPKRLLEIPQIPGKIASKATELQVKAIKKLTTRGD